MLLYCFNDKAASFLVLIVIVPFALVMCF